MSSSPAMETRIEWCATSPTTFVRSLLNVMLWTPLLTREAMRALRRSPLHDSKHGPPGGSTHRGKMHSSGWCAICRRSQDVRRSPGARAATGAGGVAGHRSSPHRCHVSEPSFPFYSRPVVPVLSEDGPTAELSRRSSRSRRGRPARERRRCEGSGPWRRPRAGGPLRRRDAGPRPV